MMPQQDSDASDADRAGEIDRLRAEVAELRRGQAPLKPADSIGQEQASAKRP